VDEHRAKDGFVLTVMALAIAAFLSGCATSPKLGKTGKLNASCIALLTKDNTDR